MNAPCLSSLHKVIILLVAGLSLTSCASDDIAIDSAPLPRAAYVEGEVLVGLKSEVVAQRASLRAELLPGGRELERIVIGGYQGGVHAVRASAETGTVPALEVLRLQLPAGMAVEDAVAQLSGHSEVLYAEPNYKVHRALTPNDGFFPKQWGLHNVGGTTFTGKWGTFSGPGPDIGAATAWDVTTGDGSVIVATIDSGIEYGHPDLAGNMWLNPGESGLDTIGNVKNSNGIDDDTNGYVDDWHGWNFVANNNNPQDDDVFGPGDPRPLGHGSHVAGIIGAVGNNSIGVSGVNWKIQLMPLKFLSSTGGGDVAKAVNAINYAVAKGARVINASYEYGGSPSQTELNAIAAAHTAGVLLVAAAGNSGANIDNGFNKVYPAAHALDNIIAVAATDPSDNKASFSNYGLTSVDLAAPGVYLYSTVRLDRTGEDGQVGYDYMSGTSMAAPMVSGAAALVWSKYPNLPAAEVRQLLLATVDTNAALSGLVASGGRLNLGRAMTVDITLPAPTAPSELTAVGQANGAFLSWIDAANSETAYIVERSLSAQPYAMIASLGANATTYTDSTVRDGVVASYRVKALAGISPSAYSNVVDVTLPLRPPASLTAYADTLGIHLSWTDASSAEKGFKVERRAEGVTTFSEIASVPVNSTGYTDKEVVAGGRYLYRVRTYSTTLGDSAYSNEILAQMAGGKSGSGGGSGCFIATAAFGTPLAPQVNTLRAFRDRVLLTNTPGRLFVALYYRTSPPLADFITEHDLLRAGVRTLLRPLIWLAEIVTPNEAQAMGLRREPPTTISEDADVVAGELLVCFRPELSAEAIATILRAEQSERLEQIASPQGTLLRIKLASGVTTTAAQKSFSAYQEVVYAEPNRRVRIRKP